MKRGAFTFVEIVITLVVLLIAGSGILGSYLSSHQLSEHASDTMEAVNHLEDVMERIRASPFTTLQTLFPNGLINGPVGNNYATIVGGYSLDGEQIVVTYPNQAPGRMEVVATLNWTYRGRARTTRLSTLKMSG